MKKVFFSVFSLFLLFACGESDSMKSVPKITELTLHTEANPELVYENFRVFPITASEQTIAAQSALQNIKTLNQGMEIPGFRVTELKQFGRGQALDYHALTVTNKSRDTIFMMGGDIVKGGNQDRVIAFDQIIVPNTVANIEVYCVEKGCSTYAAEASATEKQVAAFKGYYNVAAPKVRNTLYAKASQQEVWSAVGDITKSNNAESGTSSYTALENESTEKEKRDAFLRFFDGKLAERKDVVGIVVVCGDKILGADIFGHPDIFQNRFQPLMHGYCAELAACKTPESINEAAVVSHFGKLAESFEKKKSVNEEKVGSFNYQGLPLHIFSKKQE